MEEINQINLKLRALDSSKKNFDKKIENINKNLNQQIKNLEDELKDKIKKLKMDYEEEKQDILSGILKEEQIIIQLISEAYKKAVFAEFDRKRSTERYYPQDSKLLNELKSIIEKNNFLPRKIIEKINTLFSGKISIDELMYEQT